jgi:hypothetical protein
LLSNTNAGQSESWFSDFEVLIISVSSTVIASYRRGARRRPATEEQSKAAYAARWIASSQRLLAMTVKDAQLVGRIMIRRHESTGWRVTPSAFAP